MRHAPRMGSRARIGHEAQAAHHAPAIEQRGKNDGMAGNPRTGLAARITRLLDGFADVFVLVVEPRVDFKEAALLRSAFAELRPVREPLPRGAAVAAAGKIAEAVKHHGLRFEPELEAANFPGLRFRARLRAGARN